MINLLLNVFILRCQGGIQTSGRLLDLGKLKIGQRETEVGQSSELSASRLQLKLWSGLFSRKIY